MRCPKCSYISFDDLVSCRNCGQDLTPIAQQLHGTVAEHTAASFFLGSLVTLDQKGDTGGPAIEADAYQEEVGPRVSDELPEETAAEAIDSPGDLAVVEEVVLSEGEDEAEQPKAMPELELAFTPDTEAQAPEAIPELELSFAPEAEARADEGETAETEPPVLDFGSPQALAEASEVEYLETEVTPLEDEEPAEGIPPLTLDGIDLEDLITPVGPEAPAEEPAEEPDEEEALPLDSLELSFEGVGLSPGDEAPPPTPLAEETLPEDIMDLDLFSESEGGVAPEVSALPPTLELELADATPVVPLSSEQDDGESLAFDSDLEELVLDLGTDSQETQEPKSSQPAGSGSGLSLERDES